MPALAAEYNFEYELVEYKWPRWLNQQTEKQRIIWGYKILFLDVLFPLDVKKIIFVDADQVVRTDLKELRDLDLEGAPYGYTPFCDSRRDMEGFRFWKVGRYIYYCEAHLIYCHRDFTRLGTGPATYTADVITSARSTWSTCSGSAGSRPATDYAASTRASAKIRTACQTWTKIYRTT